MSATARKSFFLSRPPGTIWLGPRSEQAPLETLWRVNRIATGHPTTVDEEAMARCTGALRRFLCTREREF